jgi:NAD-reducing hydrogenase small subunit
MDQMNTTTASAVEGKVRVATVWLGGCSGCHMSFVDLDERLFDLAGKISLVYGPLMDAKEFPENVAATLVEGAIANNEHLHLIRQIRNRTKILVSFGDCAVSGNITALRNPLGKVEPVLQRAYIENAAHQPQIPSEFSIIPKMLDRVHPVHEVVKVDVFLPGCPPSADQIYFVLTELLDGRVPDLAGKLKFG